MAAAQSAYARLLDLSMRSMSDLNLSRISKFCTALGELRQLVACVVCRKLLVDPYHPKGHHCDHFVCRLCVRGKKRLSPKCPKCNDCSDYKIYVEDRAMTLQLLCYKTLCVQILQSGLYPQLENQKIEVSSNINKPRIKLPSKSVQEFIVEGSEYDDIRDMFLFEPDIPCLKTLVSSLPDETPNISKATTPEVHFTQSLPEQLSISDMEIEVETATGGHHHIGSPIPLLPTGSRVGLQRQVLVTKAKPQSLVTSNWSELNFSSELSSVNNLQEGTYTYVLPDPSDASYIVSDSSLLIGQLVQIDTSSELVPDQALAQKNLKLIVPAKESVVVTIPEKSAIIPAAKEKPHPASASGKKNTNPAAAVAKEQPNPAGPAAKEKPNHAAAIKEKPNPAAAPIKEKPNPAAVAAHEKPNPAAVAAQEKPNPAAVAAQMKQNPAAVAAQEKPNPAAVAAQEKPVSSVAKEMSVPASKQEPVAAKPNESSDIVVPVKPVNASAVLLPSSPPAAAAVVKQVKKKLNITSKGKSSIQAAEKLPMKKHYNKIEAFKQQLVAAVMERVIKKKAMAVTKEKQDKRLPKAVVTPVKKDEEHVVTPKRKHAQMMEEEKSTHMRLRKQTATIASSVQVQPPGKEDSSKRQPATKSSASKVNKPTAVDLKKRKHCRCGISGPSTPKTCRNNRCWCYINGNSCTDCSCQGCNNPHKQDYVDTDDEMDDGDDDEDDDEILANLKTDIIALKEQQKSIPLSPPPTTTTSHSSNMGFEGLTLVALSNPEQSQHPLVLVQNENNEMQCFNIFQGDVPIDPANYGFQRVQLQNKDSGNSSIPQYAYMAMPPDLLDQAVSGDGHVDSSSLSPEVKKFKNIDENKDACPGDSMTATETAHSLFEDIMSGSDDL
ncbi:E3 ubiquitin-protein ligase msl-2 [Drosophila tropicalis]|uniref:E3 ubiquitin-protein ligase msl-2 n=1 Tax=Drosophila tropicalis TaxID=46794 RepID=UPI0035AC09E8